MNIKDILDIPPSPYKAKLASCGIKIKQLAKYLNQNYAHTCHQLSGTYPIPPSTKEKIDELINEIESNAREN